MFLGPRRMQFRQHLKKLRQQAENFVQIPKVIEVQLFRKVFPKLFLWIGGMNALWQTRWKIFNRRPKNLRSLSKNEEENIFWWEVFFPQKCSYGHVKRNFVNPVGTCSLEGQICYGRRPIMIKKSFFLSSLIGDCSYGLWECSFLTNPTKKSCKKGGNFSLKVRIW